MAKPTRSATNPNHYNKYDIEPIEYIRSLGIIEPYCVGNVIKYVSRYRDKNGVEDLEKAAVYLAWLIEEKRLGDNTTGSGSGGRIQRRGKSKHPSHGAADAARKKHR